MLSTLKAALRSVHGEEKVAEEVSGYYIADEIQMTHRGMMIAIPEDEWVVFHDLPPVVLADVLVRLARSVSLPKLRKHPRGEAVGHLQAAEQQMKGFDLAVLQPRRRDGPPLAARRATAWRAGHGGRAMADPADRRDPRPVRARHSRGRFARPEQVRELRRGPGHAGIGPS